MKRWLAQYVSRGLELFARSRVATVKGIYGSPEVPEELKEVK